MQTITIAIDNDSVLKTLQGLEEKHFIRIIEKNNLDSPAIPGPPISLNEFIKWINDAEEVSTVSLDEAKKIWPGKRKQLQKIIR